MLLELGDQISRECAIVIGWATGHVTGTSATRLLPTALNSICCVYAVISPLLDSSFCLYMWFFVNVHFELYIYTTSLGNVLKFYLEFAQGF